LVSPADHYFLGGGAVFHDNRVQVARGAGVSGTP
jgi:hypothetical protein